MLGNDILMLGKSLIKWKQRPDIIIAVDWDVKHQFKHTNILCVTLTQPGTQPTIFTENLNQVAYKRLYISAYMPLA